MFQLGLPDQNFEEVLSGCIDGMQRASELKRRLSNSRAELRAVEPPYVNRAKSGLMCKLPSIPAGASNSTVVCNELTKGDLAVLYNDYFVKKGKPNRRIYEDLINTAEQKCPFCGGIGVPSNLDHFLPKSRYPQYSVLPTNLVPACQDCNLLFKSDSVPVQALDQVLHPYLDKDIYFNTQWVFAEYNSDSLREAGEISFHVDAPRSWDNTSRQRVQRHFQDFSLGRRYGGRAAEELPIVLEQMCKVSNLGLAREAVANTILDPPIDLAPFINHWRRVYYQAIKSWYLALDLSR